MSGAGIHRAGAPAGLAAAIIAGFVGLDSEPAEAGAPVALAPHRAVYDMTFDRARGASGISDISGRLVFELLGSPCEGYTVNRRFVSHIAGEELTTTSDQQLTTFEEADGSAYRFISRSYFDDSLSEAIDGRAVRGDGEVVVELSKPHEDELRLPGDILFPVQHLKRLLKAARAGDSMLLAKIFEGSDAGQTVYETTAVIARPRHGSRVPDVPGAEALEGVESWHVAIAYYENPEGAAELPKYEFSYELYANGVSAGVMLDYGDFALRGELTSLEFVEEPPCE